jgi:hypothetical protein
MSETIQIEKAESNPSSSDSRLRLGEIGNPYLKAIGGYIEESAKKELQFPHSLTTYDKMASTSAVSQGLTAGEVFLTKSLLATKFIAGVSGSQESKDFAAFLNWNIKNFVGNSWYDAITNIITFRKYGFAWLEKVFAKNDSIKWSGKYKYKYAKLAPRAQKSVREWVFDDAVLKRDLVGLHQWMPATVIGQSNINPFTVQNLTDKFVRREKFMLFSWNSTGNNPQGKSDLYDCFKSWKELEMITSYEVVGVSKDLGGILILRTPNDHINKAAEDPDSLEAQTLRALQKNAAAIHAGDQTYILLGSDTHGETGNGKYVYDVELKGVDGGSKAYKTSELIEARKKDILNVLGASFLLVGQGDTGSHSLSDSSRSVHAFYMERMLMYIKTVFEREFVKSLADINELKLEEDDMPVMTFGELDEADPENNAKVVQLMAGVGMMVKDKSIIIQAHKMTGFDTTEIEKLTEEQLLAKLTPDTARVGESGGSSGTGTSQLKNPNSTRNMANSA